jgi:hypothetical protein
MKKVLFLLIAMALQQTGLAQDIELNNQGAYERKEVVTVDGSTSGVLFGRAMEALSDWTGPDGRSKVGIDYQDKDAGTVIYKGEYFIDYKRGVLVTANFTLKVRCKDGRAQVAVTIPSMTAKAGKLGMEKSVSIADVKAKPKRGAYKYLPQISEIADTLIASMRNSLSVKDDDDF